VGVILLWVCVFPRESQNPIVVALLATSIPAASSPSALALTMASAAPAMVAACPCQGCAAPKLVLRRVLPQPEATATATGAGARLKRPGCPGH
jgi:hypothetical protein